LGSIPCQIEKDGLVATYFVKREQNKKAGHETGFSDRILSFVSNGYC
jgi:hypothetical protein